MSLADQSQQWYPTSVQVTVLQARNLRIKGKNGTNDAYAVMQVAKEKFATSVAEKTASPMWKEEAAFELPLFQRGDAERCTLRVSVLHRALVGPDKLLGQAAVNLLELNSMQSRSKTEWLKLLDKAGKPDKDRGEILVNIQFLRNNMTASMFDLSAPDKQRSRLGKLKDKVRGKKKEGLSDSASAVVPTFTQVLTDSEGEGEPEGDGAADKQEKQKKHKLKSLFSPKSNLQRNVSQSMSVLGPLPERNSSLTGSRSSGLNVDSSEGKKKFKFLTHKRTGSSDSKGSQGPASILGRSRQASATSADQSNLCINGSHVYTEEPQARSSRAGSTFSLASSGRGSMEDLRRSQGRKSSVASVDSLKAGKQHFSWEEESIGDREEQEEEEEVLELEGGSIRAEQAPERKLLNVEQRAMEDEKKRVREVQEEESIRRIEQERRRLMEKEQMKEEMERAEEKERIRREKEEEIRIKEQEKKKVEEDNRRIEEEERIRREERDHRKVMEDAEKIRFEEEEKRAAEERKNTLIEEEVRRATQEYEEEKVRQQERLFEEEERKKEEEWRKAEEERRRKLQEDRVKREEEHRLKVEEDERKRLEEEDRVRKEVEECRRKEEEERKIKEMEDEKRKIEERRRRKEEEERKIKEMEDEKRKIEERRRRKEEEDRLKREEEHRLKVEEEERKRLDLQEKMRKEDELRKEEEERRRLEEEDRLKREEEHRLKMEEEEMKRLEEEERVRKEVEEHRLKVEEEEMKRLDLEEKMRKEDELRKEEEERRRLEEEERVRKEVEECRLKEEKERKIKEMEDEKRKIEERRKEEDRLKREEEHRLKVEEEKRKREEEEDRVRKEVEECRQKEEEERKIKEMEEKRKREDDEKRKIEERRKEEEDRLKEEEDERKIREQQRLEREMEEKREEERENVKRLEEESLKKVERQKLEEKRRAEDQKMKATEEKERARLEEERRKEADLEKERKRRREEEEQGRQEQEKMRLTVAEKKMVLQDRGGEALMGKNPFEEDPSEDSFEDFPSTNPFEETSTAQSTEPLNRTTKVSAVKPSSSSCLNPSRMLAPPNPFFSPSELEGPTAPPVGHQGIKTSQDSSASQTEKKRQAPLPPDSLSVPRSSNVATANPTKPTLRSHSAAELGGETDARQSKDGVCLDRCGALQDKRPAPQPPDSLRGKPDTQIRTQEDLRRTKEMLSKTDRPGEEKESFFSRDSLCAVQVIAPLKASTTATREESKGLEGQGFLSHRNQRIDVSAIPSATGGFRVVKKGPAPSKPDSSSLRDKTVTEYDGNTTNVQQLSVENYPSNRSPVVFEINSVAGSGKETQSHKTCDEREGLKAPNQTGSINEEVTLRKSSKVSRAPLPPAKMKAISAVTLETPQNSQTPGSSRAVNKHTNNTMMEQPVNIMTQTQCFSDPAILDGSPGKTPEPQPVVSGQGVWPQARSQTCEARCSESSSQGGEEVGGKRGQPASASRRPHPVKPLSSSEQQPLSTIQGVQPEKSEAITGGTKEKIKVQEPAVTGPFSQLTQEELISLVVKQQKQLADKDKKIAELELYIDNLLVRVIEEAPCILMSLNSPKH